MLGIFENFAFSKFNAIVESTGSNPGLADYLALDSYRFQISNPASKSAVVLRLIIAVWLGFSISAFSCPEAISLGKSEAIKEKEKGDFLFYHGDLPEALEAFESAVALDPDFIAAHMSLVNIYLMLKLPDKALASARAVVRLRPKDAISKQMLANLLRSQDLHQEAVEHLEEIAEPGEKGATARISLGYSYMQINDLQSAEKNFEMAREFSATRRDALLGLAICRFRAGEHKRAINELDEIISEYGDDFSLAHLTKGHLLAGIGRLDEAVASYKEAARSRESDSALQISLGNAYFKQGKLEDASRAFMKAIECSGGGSEPYYALGVIKQKQGDLIEASRYFERGALVESKPEVKRKMLRHARRLSTNDNSSKYADLPNRIRILPPSASDGIILEDLRLRPAGPVEIFGVDYPAMLRWTEIQWKAIRDRVAKAIDRIGS